MPAESPQMGATGRNTELVMGHTPHELAAEFPQYVETMSRLKQENAHFARIFDDYHEINRAIHRAETLVEPMDDTAEQALRRRRMALKDEIYSFLRAA